MSYDRQGRKVAPAPLEADGTAAAVPRPRAVARAPQAAARPPAGGATGNGGAKRRRQLRVLPLLIFTAALLLTVKVGEVWQTLKQPKAKVTASQLVAAAQIASPAGAQAKDPANDPAKAEQVAQATETKPADGEAKPGEKPLDPVLFTRSEIELLQELSKRRKELDIREQAVIQKEGLLAAAEDRIDKKIKEMRTVRTDIEGLIKKYDEQEEKQLKDLVNIYEKMKPKDAAQIFDELELPILLQLYERMQANTSAPVLAVMKPERAKEITTRIAERRQMPKLN